MIVNKKRREWQCFVTGSVLLGYVAQSWGSWLVDTTCHCYLINLFNFEDSDIWLDHTWRDRCAQLTSPAVGYIILQFYKTWSYLLCFMRHDASIVDRMISISIYIIFRVLYSLKTKACIRNSDREVPLSCDIILFILHYVQRPLQPSKPSLLFICLSSWPE
jgi:hypothetical protein